MYQQEVSVVLGRFSSYQKKHEPLPDGASDMMPYAVAYSYIPYSSLQFLFRGFDSFIQQYSFFPQLFC